MFVSGDERSFSETCRSYGAFWGGEWGTFLFYKYAAPTEFNVIAQVVYVRLLYKSVDEVRHG